MVPEESGAKGMGKGTSMRRIAGGAIPARLTARGSPCARTFEACARPLESAFVKTTPMKWICGHMAAGEIRKNPHHADMDNRNWSRTS